MLIWRRTRGAGVWWMAAVAVALGRAALGPQRVALIAGALLALALGSEALAPRQRDSARPPALWARPTAWAAALGWSAAGVVTFLAPAGHSRSLHGLTAHAHVLAPWPLVTDLLIAAAAVASALALRTRARPGALGTETSQAAVAHARAIVAEHGDDSLSPFVVRPDKALQFAGGAVLGYRVVGDTAVVSGDPVGPEPGVAAVVAELLARSRGAGLGLAMYGVSDRHLGAYRALGLRAMCVGEEAIVDPTAFTLEGRAVRKLRQSVTRVSKRGWTLEAIEGRAIGSDLEAEIDVVEATWRAGRERMLGFAMSMGEYDPGVRSSDVYLLARSPSGELCAVMRFLAHRENLSLDTMRRVGDTPNGLNEALVCRAIEYAREHDVRELSLNYAGLAHLVRRPPSGGRIARALRRGTIGVLGRRFQMDRLVLFCEKFSPRWRPRYLVYESRALLPRAIVRVLQAEGYLPEPRRRAARFVARLLPPAPATDAWRSETI